ncbi:alpha/beta hydrolase-fold protein [Streptomyces sp. NPDC057257]|uniref:alpha/beta hydrolase-fold protein n=1 Tax=Streptomyces sp. NPDC057257 TaxID=3346071 RepID=UPI0036441D5D
MGATVAVAAGATACGSGSDDSGSGSGSGGDHVKSATAITQVYGDGQKFIAVALEYDSAVDTSKLSKSSFKVDGRTVTKVYANTSASLADTGRDGKYVIVELSPDDSGALLWGNDSGGGSGTGKASGSASASASGSAPAGGGPKVGEKGTAKGAEKAKGTVTSTGSVTTTDGSTYPGGSTELATGKQVNLIVDDFKQFSYKDPKTGKTLPYNLFIPKDYDESKKYPLVLFMHDASVVSTVTTATLVQGLGAVVWASPEDQAERPAFVLAPQYPEVVVGDDYKPTAYFDTTAHLVQELTGKYSIDADRVYSTGQSMGAMMTLGLNIKYPDLFGASWVVAGQWPSSQAAPLAKKNLFVTVSQGDSKAYPGEDAIMSVIEKAGTKVSRATWNAKSTAAQFTKAVDAISAKGTSVNYVTFEKGTTLTAESKKKYGTMEHNSSWAIAYTIEGVREWIFQQRK